MEGVVIDANVLKRVLAETGAMAEEEKGPLEILLDQIIDRYGLAINRFIQQEWQNTCGEQYITIRLAELAKAGKVQDLPTDGSNQVRGRLQKECGLPQSSRDYTYIDCARRIWPFYLLTEDIDLFDPRQKRGTAAAKKRARRDRQGALCRLAWDDYSVKIGCYCHCGPDLTLEPVVIPDGSHPCLGSAG